MAWNISCDTCGEDLGKTTENYREINCGNCGDTTINPDDRYLRDEDDKDTGGRNSISRKRTQRIMHNLPGFR